MKLPIADRIPAVSSIVAANLKTATIPAFGSLLELSFSFFSEWPRWPFVGRKLERLFEILPREGGLLQAAEHYYWKNIHKYNCTFVNFIDCTVEIYILFVPIP